MGRPRFFWLVMKVIRISRPDIRTKRAFITLFIRKQKSYHARVLYTCARVYMMGLSRIRMEESNCYPANEVTISSQNLTLGQFLLPNSLVSGRFLPASCSVFLTMETFSTAFGAFTADVKPRFEVCRLPPKV